MKSKLSLEELRVVSFRTNIESESHVGGNTYNYTCDSNFQNCDTGDPIICASNEPFCFVTEAVNCTGNCTWLC
jgi:hypothetical protein